MKLLLDTHLLLWAARFDPAVRPRELSAAAVGLIDDPANDLIFSAASIWEVAIKSGLGRTDFQVDPHLLRRGLIDNGYEELAIRSEHAAAVKSLPDLHKDPFDRLLLVQAQVEGITLLTSDRQVAAYGGPIQLV